MRDPVYTYFGIFKIDVYQVITRVQIRNLANKDLCLIRDDGPIIFLQYLLFNNELRERLIQDQGKAGELR